MLNLNSIVQRASDVIAAESGHDLVMVSVTKGLYYGISDVARGIWEAIEHPKKVSDLVDDLTATYRIDREACAQEAIVFLESLRAEELLQVRDGSFA